MIYKINKNILLEGNVFGGLVGAAAVGATAGGLMGYNSRLKQNTPRN